MRVFCIRATVYERLRISGLEHEMKVIDQLYLDELSDAQFSGTINTVPNLPNNSVSSGYKELEVVAILDRSNHYSCIWKFAEHKDNSIVVEIFTPPLIVCEDREVLDGFDFMCFESNGVINTSLIILNSIETDVTVSIECSDSFNSFFVIQASSTLHVRGA